MALSFAFMRVPPSCSGIPQVVLHFMAVPTDRNQPFDWLFADITPRVSLMVYLGGGLATMDACPVIALEHYMPLPLPVI